MPHKTPHLTDEELLLTTDREISARRADYVRTHLPNCPECSARMERINATAAQFFAIHHEELNAELPPAATSRARLKAELEALDGGSGLRSWLDRTSHLLAGPRWAYALGAVLIVALGLWLLFGEPRVRDSRDFATASDSGPLLPEPRLTPGATRPIDVRQVCTPGPPDQMATIPVAVRQQVFHEYGMDQSQPREYEVDHLITPELGGTDDIHNLWPEPYSSTEWNAYVKDQLEDHLRQMVCDGKLDLPTAQRDIATNWISAYRRYFHTDKPLTSVSSLIWAEDRKPAAMR